MFNWHCFSCLNTWRLWNDIFVSRRVVTDFNRECGNRSLEGNKTDVLAESERQNERHTKEYNLCQSIWQMGELNLASVSQRSTVRKQRGERKRIQTKEVMRSRLLISGEGAEIDLSKSKLQFLASHSSKHFQLLEY